MMSYERVYAQDNVYRAIKDDDLSTLRTLDVVGPFAGCGNKILTPLNFAIMYNAFKCGEWLVSSIGVDIEHCFYYCTPLTRAVCDGHEQFTKLLLDAGAQVEAVDADGWTALMHSLMRCNYSIAYKLIDHGAHLHTPTGDYSQFYYEAAITYYEARLQRRVRQRAFMAAVLSMRSDNKDLVRLFSIKR
jgi:hypothetical protein